MAETTIQQKLAELQRQFGALQSVAHEPIGRARELVPTLVAGLQQALRDLECLATEVTGKEHVTLGVSTSRGTTPTTESQSSQRTRFRSLAERDTLLVRSVRTRARCGWANRAWLEYSGRSSEQLLGERWLECVHPEDRERCVSIYDEAFDSHRLYRLEYRLQRRSGEYGWVLEIGTPRVTSQGSVRGYLGTAIEITAYKRAEIYLSQHAAIARVLADSDTLDQAAASILKIVCESSGWDVGELWFADEQSGVGRCIRQWVVPSFDVAHHEPGSHSSVVSHGFGAPSPVTEPTWIADLGTDAPIGQPTANQGRELRAMLCVPIACQGEVRAFLRVLSRDIRPREENVVAFLTATGVLITQFSERRESEARLRVAEVLKSAILDGALDAVITIDVRGIVHEFNASAETIFGYPRSAAVGRSLVDLIVPPSLREQALTAFALDRLAHDDGLLGERFSTTAMKSNGAEFPVDVSMVKSGLVGDSLYTIYVCDASVRIRAEQDVKLYQERLRSLTADLLLAEEQERRRLALDLHDGLAQTIALAQIKLFAVRLTASRRQKIALDEIQDLVAQANQSARSISAELSPLVLHDFGLEPAVQWLVENIQSRYGIEIEFEDDGQPKPADEKTRIIFFRSIRELLINAAKHAKARHVHVRLERAEDQLSALVEDDGVGMDPAHATDRGSGLISIHERLNHVGGSMRIDSAPGQGTRIHLCAPLSVDQPTEQRMEA